MNSKPFFFAGPENVKKTTLGICDVTSGLKAIFTRGETSQIFRVLMDGQHPAQTMMAN